MMYLARISDLGAQIGSAVVSRNFKAALSTTLD